MHGQAILADLLKRDIGKAKVACLVIGFAEAFDEA
tara:strand:- start:97 stop:201 length:105 start_codon:yes stop_codon:yes gene_type:complete